MNATTQLIDFIKANNESAALELLQAGPEAARGRGADGESAVLTAVYYGKLDLAREIAQRTDPDIHEASALGLAERVKELLASGVRHDARSFDGWTPLHLTAFFGHIDAAQVLIEHGAELEAISANSTANTPLCAALAGKGDIEFVRMLLAKGANVNARVEAGITPLHIAASRGVMEMIEVLLAAGADSRALMDDGTTPAAMAEKRGHAEAAARLL